MRQLDYRLLGPFEVLDAAKRLPLGRTQQRAVLAILLLHANRAVSTDQLVELVWPDKPPGEPRTAIQGYVSALRKLFGRETIETAGGGYLLRADREQLDLHRFERLLREGREATDDPRKAAQLLDKGLALWRGPALSDFTYEPWAQQEIGRLEELRLVAREMLIEARLGLGEQAELVGELEALIHEHPLRERPRGQLMVALYRCGRQAEALDAYREAREQLLEDLGIDPSPELQALYRQILNQDEALTVEPPPPRPPTNLPAPPNALIGRETELTELENLCRRADLRLLTLTGPGGVGKTRLALQLAAQLLDEFPAGVFFVALAPLTEPNLLLPTIAQTLALHEHPGETLTDTIAEHLREKEVLLVADNFEHLLDAASQLAELLREAPKLKLVVTSRAPLHLSGEHVYFVPPLALPDTPLPAALEALMQYEAVSLFVERARAVRPGFTVTAENAPAVAEICLRVDGLPLAIELAAAWIPILSPQALLKRLDQRLRLLTGGPRDVAARQQTLRDTIAWSYGLLAESEQRLFASLSVFVGGCRIDAAEAVCDPDGELGIDVLDGLSSLTEKNLLRQREDRDGEPRFWMLETIREFAIERLQALGIASLVEGRHIGYFLDLAEKSEAEGKGPRAVIFLDRLDAENANLRASLGGALAAGEIEYALRLCGALHKYWLHRGHFEEALRAGEELLARSSSARSELRGKALGVVGEFAGLRGDDRRATEALEERLALHEEEGDQTGVAGTLTLLGHIASREADFTRAIDCYERSLALIGEGYGEPWLTTALALNNLGWALLHQGDLSRARALLERGMSEARALGSTILEGQIGNNLARLALEAGELEESQSLLREALQLAANIGEKQLLEESLDVMGRIAAATGRPLRAARLVGAADALCEEIGLVLWDEERVRRERFFAPSRAEIGVEQWSHEHAAGRAMSLEQALAYAVEEPASRS